MTSLRLDAIPLFADLDPDEASEVLPIFQEVSFPPGHTVVAEGEDGQEMFVLVSGKVRVVKSMLLRGLDLPALTGKDARKVLAVLTGETSPVFGEMALINAETRSATVETLETSVFLKTDRHGFFALIHRKPKLGCKLLANLAKHLADMVRASNHEVVKLTTALALVLAAKR
jgi:CRP/FNR family transcriptional regulator, cyclic AMP receptor protein